MKSQMINLHVIGGFLGSGKTTTIARLIEKFSEPDKLGIIVNDFSSPLVDQKWLENFGVNVQNIAGGCVCTTASSLVKAIEHFEILNVKNVILEPIGTHLNIANAVYSILSSKAHDIIFKPVTVILDCVRISQLLKHLKRDYILEMIELQISSADIIFVNKIDISEKEDLDIVDNFLSKYDVPVIYGSALNSVGIDQLFNAMVNGFSSWDKKLLKKEELLEQYKKYIRFQKKMIWVNLNFKANGYYMEIVNEIIKDFYTEFSENYLGHLKIIVLGEGGYAKFNLTSWDSEYSIDDKLILNAGNWQIVVNLRIEGNEEKIASKIERLIEKLSNLKVNLLDKRLMVPILKWGMLQK